jgi:hypothetical protein
MNERIKELAAQAGFVVGVSANADRQIKHFAELVRHDEREACARLCDAMAKHPEYAESATTKLAAYAIRSRSGTITLAELRKTDLYRNIQTKPLREALK